ncbi:MAG TPA: rod shape-determining protein RodA, partial [Chryseolinea sp.]|nr:rod shape-determining protein RodA [Chryseolinea sp.]
MRQEAIISNKVDWVTVMLYGAMVLWGWLNIYSATYDVNQSIFDLTINSGRQMMFIITSFILIAAILIIDMRFYETFAYIIFGAVMFLLLLVPFIGKEVGGNRAWLGIGSFGVQPSEFAKFATALAVARFIGSVGFKMDQLRNQLFLFGIISAPILLILLQKDYGTAMVFLVFVLVFYREGMSPFLLLVGLGVAVIFILTLLVENNWFLYGTIAFAWGVVIFISRKKKLKRMAVITLGAFVLVGTIFSVDVIFSKLEDHHQKRIMVLINPELDQLGAGYHVYQSKVAIGSGGFMGKGFL